MPRVSDFVEAICESPGDDTPRLIYADFLEENGDLDRAEFIRLQCERALLPVWDRRAKELRYREWLLLCKNSRRWHAELPVIEGVTWGRFERGFVSEVKVLFLEEALKKHEEIRRQTPICGVECLHYGDLKRWQGKEPISWLRKLKATVQSGCLPAHYFARESGMFEHLQEFHLYQRQRFDRRFSLEEVWLPRLQKLYFPSAELTTEATISLLNLECLHNLKTLIASMGYGEESYDAEKTIAKYANKWDLESLTISGLSTTAQLESLLNSWTCGNLKSLHLQVNQFVEGDFDLGAILLQQKELKEFKAHHNFLKRQTTQTLICEPIAKHLQVLELFSEQLNEDFLSVMSRLQWPCLHQLRIRGDLNNQFNINTLRFVESPNFPSLEDLEFRDIPIPVSFYHRLPECPWASGLRWLSLENTQFEQGYLLSQAENLHSLWGLNLRNNRLQPVNILAMLEAKWPQLTQLFLGSNNVGMEGAEQLCRSGLLEQLVVLDLTNASLAPLSRSLILQTPSSTLDSVNLGGNGLMDDDLIRLSANHWPNLRKIELTGNHDTVRIGDLGLRALYESSLFKKLQFLTIWGAKVPPELGPAFGRLFCIYDKPIWDEFCHINHDPWN